MARDAPLLLCAMLGGCHQQRSFNASEWIIIAIGVVFVGLVWLLDEWRLRAGYRVEPAPYVGMSEATSIQQKIAAEADKQHEQAGGEK